MYAVYKQAHPPTGLEFSMYCNFFNNSERNLVVAGTSQLYVYRLNRDAEVGRPAPAAAPRGEGCPVETGQTGPVVGCVQSLFSSLPRSSTSFHSWRARRLALRFSFALSCF